MTGSPGNLYNPGVRMIRSARPAPEGRGKGVYKWDYFPIDNGKSDVGFLAGPPCGCWTHYAGNTKPCRRMMTGSKLHCGFCEEKYEPVWRGAVPVYDREYVRRFVWITEDYFEATCEIETHAQIRLSRAKDTHAPVVIRPENWRTTPLPLTSGRADTVYMMPFLTMILWKDTDLAQFSEQTTLAELVTTVEAEPQEPPVKKGPEQRLAEKQDKQDREAAKNLSTIRKTMAQMFREGGDGGGEKRREKPR